MSYKIDRLDDFGRGITKDLKTICFVSNALPSEEVELDITNKKSKYIEAETKKIIRESSDRVKPLCPYYLLCGGCNIMHMNYDAQLKFKKSKVENIIRRFAGLDNIVKDIIPSIELNYRNKVTLKVKNNSLGYFKDKSNELVSIDYCYLCNESINKVINELNNIELENIYEVIIKSNYLNESLVCFIGNNIDSNYLKNNLLNIDNIVVIDNQVKNIIKGNDYIIDMIDSLKFKVSVDSFFQVNSYQVKNLYNKVLEYASLTGNETVLDLYCGTGTIGMFLSSKAKHVYGVEINESAVKDANFNKELNNINNIEFICEDANKIKDKFNNIDLVVVDPPRSGLGNGSINYLLDISPKKIIYVSCDPVTLARDLCLLKETHNIKELTPVDMFPNTYHCESVCILERRLL